MNFKKEQSILDCNNRLMNFLDFVNAFNQLYSDFLIKNNWIEEKIVAKLTYNNNKKLFYKEIYYINFKQVDEGEFKMIHNFPFMFSYNYGDCEVIIGRTKLIQHKNWKFYLTFFNLLFSFKNILPIFIDLQYISDKKNFRLFVANDSEDNAYDLSFDLFNPNLTMRETVITLVQFTLNKVIEFSHSPKSQEKQKELKLQYIDKLDLQDFFE